MLEVPAIVKVVWFAGSPAIVTVSVPTETVSVRLFEPLTRVAVWVPDGAPVKVPVCVAAAAVLVLRYSVNGEAYPYPLLLAKVELLTAVPANEFAVIAI